MTAQRTLFTLLLAGLHITACLASEGKTPANEPSTRSVNRYKIAFASNRTGDFEIYLAHLDGSDVVRLTRRPGTDEFPFCAPDGKTIAVQSEGAMGDAEIYLMRPDGTGLINWTNHRADDLYPRWSADAKRIAFMSNRAGNYDIYIGYVDGPGLIQITRDASDDAFPSWRPNIIAFVSKRYGNPEICITGDDGSFNPVRLTTNPGVDEFPFWSPDGRWLVYHSEIAGSTDICRIQADGTGWTNLTHNAARDEYPAWSRDGQWIAFASNRDGNWNIYKVKSDGTELVRLTDDPGDDLSPAWFPDGTGLLFQRSTQSGGTSDIWAMRPDGSNARRITIDPADDGYVSWLRLSEDTD